MQHIKLDHIELSEAVIAWAKANKGFNPEPDEHVYIIFDDGGTDIAMASASLLCGVPAPDGTPSSEN
jgi:hypothetical protein